MSALFKLSKNLNHITENPRHIKIKEIKMAFKRYRISLIILCFPVRARLLSKEHQAVCREHSSGHELHTSDDDP